MRLTSAPVLIAIAALLAPMAASSTATGAVAPPAPDRAAPRAAEERAPGPVVVDMTKKWGPRFTDWGYDIKQPTRATLLSKSAANRAAVFGTGRFRVLRIPLRADDTAVTKKLGVNPSVYATTVKVAAAVKQEYPHVRIFASLKTIDDCGAGSAKCPDFATVLKKGNKPSGAVMGSRYGVLVGKYLTYMRKHGVPVAVLGVDNEGGGAHEAFVDSNNEGQIDGAKFGAIIKAAGKHYKPAMPQLIFNDAKIPDTDTLCGLGSATKAKLSYSSTHYKVSKRMKKMKNGVLVRDQLAALKACLPNKKAWDTELHYTDAEMKVGVYDANVFGMESVFDHVDAGFTGITWWGYRGTETTDPTGQIQAALVDSTYAAYPLATTDGDGTATGAGNGWFTSRAFKSGSDLQVWVLNDTGDNYANKGIKVTTKDGVVVPSSDDAITYVRWTRNVSGGLDQSTGIGRVASDVPQVPFPAHTITLVTLHGVV